MTSNPNATLESLVIQSLAKCLQRLERVSAGTWQVAGAKVTTGTVGDALGGHNFKNPAVAVYFNLKGISPLTAIMLFDPGDMECISKCFTGHSFPHGSATTMAEEVMLTELGNIVMNSLINGLLNALRRQSIPTIPGFAEGGLAELTAELGKTVNVKQGFRIITASLNLKWDAATAKVEAIALVPEELAMELELLQPPAAQ